MYALILLAVLILLAGPVGLVLAVISWSRGRRLEREIAALRADLSQVGPTGVDRGLASPPAGVHPAHAGSPAQEPPVATGAAKLAALAGAGSTEVASGAREERADARAAAEETLLAGTPSSLPPALPARPRDLESRIGGEWLTWIGVLAIFFGTAFFLAVPLGTHPLAGQGQVWVGIAVAAGFLAVGTWVSGRSSLFLAQGLLGGGTALIFLSIFAASAFHKILGATTAYLLFALASGFGAALAIRQNSRTVASLTLAGALLTPILLEPVRSHPLFFPYLVFVNAGAVAVRLKKSWPGLVLASFLVSFLLVVFWWDRSFSPDTRTEALLGVGALWLLYLALPFFARTSALGWRVAGSALVFANAGAGVLFLHFWLRSLAFLEGTLVALLGLFYVGLSRLRARPSVALLYELAGLVLGALALPIHFDLETVTLGWALLAVVLVYLGLRRSSLGHRLLGYVVLLAALGHHVLFDLMEWTRPNGTGPQWAAGLVAAAAILAIAWLLSRARDRAEPVHALERQVTTPLILAASAFVLYLLSVQVWRGLADQGARRAQLGLSLSWALYGGALIAVGFFRRYRPLRLAGVGLLLILVIKLFAVDMSVLDRGERIASFVGVGVLLLVVSLLYQRKKRT